jgi:hypothetical protein
LLTFPLGEAFAAVVEMPPDLSADRLPELQQQQTRYAQGPAQCSHELIGTWGVGLSPIQGAEE